MEQLWTYLTGSEEDREQFKATQTRAGQQSERCRMATPEDYYRELERDRQRSEFLDVQSYQHKWCFFFCQELSHHSGIKDVLSKFEPEVSVKAACVLLLLMAYFKEPKDAILLQADTCATGADVQRTMMLPSSPRLIIQDDMMKPKAWMLSIEGQVVMGPHHDFVNGIATIFASYYNLNLQYPDDASSTLEFIQRCFLGINPESGSKSKKKHGHINQ
ncbi:uncharacterized protein LOC114641604 [Erpetoichthys calabaricus]|uniref:uncharacterized protein LOC114641604 n=1 Tax=Erpetoichthys calabaricus TaxID=27687 RepID=UPI0022343E17|nr:uncharacterized protein LOC114641604 [Erpetoichthys calabaricus]